MSRGIFTVGERVTKQPALVSVQGLVHAYGKQKVLQGLGMELQAGQFYALVGPNGTGKSTLLRVLAGALPLVQGQVSLAGYALDAYETQRAAQLAWVHENVHFNVPASLQEITDVFAAIHTDWDASRFHKLRNELALDLSKTYVKLSRGQRVQFQLLLALARNPKVFLLDEVTAVLDVGVRELLLGELKRAVGERGALVLAATNILTELRDYADRLLVLRDGVLVANESVDALIQRYSSIEKAAVALGGRKVA